MAIEEGLSVKEISLNTICPTYSIHRTLLSQTDFGICLVDVVSEGNLVTFI